MPAFFVASMKGRNLVIEEGPVLYHLTLLVSHEVEGQNALCRTVEIVEVALRLPVDQGFLYF